MVVKKKFKKNDEDIENFDEGDITGSEDELSESDRRLLEKVRKKHVPENLDSDDEVYGLKDGNVDDNEEEQEKEDDYDSLESDMDGPREDDDLPNERAWGKKKTAYYSTDFVDPDYEILSHKKMQAAELEEQEARTIQQRLAQQLDEADFGLDLIEPQVDSDEAPDEKVVKVDWSKMSKRKRVEYFLKENPEFDKVVSDVKKYLKEANEVLSPFLDLVDKLKVSHPSIDFVKIKYRLVLNYSVNVSFYLMLKAKKIPVSSHPVLIKIAQYRKLLTQLEENQGEILDKVSELVKSVSNEKLLQDILGNSNPDNEEEDDAEMDGMSGLSKDDDEEMEEHPEVEVSGEEKRPITTQIAKNKGLTPYRKKELKNPRVKHRIKFRKAKIRRKGAVREVRKELKRYDGEISGIKASVKKGIKLK
ncbi:UTP3 small subunit processome component Sas10 [Cotesia typhae]|uniref:UTP3 small subunit processome component Sas10 n=1 Tax=Cotesia typhae TaxID=2053667 RepID=UPI003D684544